MTTLTQRSAKAPAANRPEVELLLCCARTCIDSATAEQVKTLLQQDIDWTYLIETAAFHQVIPLLYQSLKNNYAEEVPDAILNLLRSYFYANGRRNFFLTNELLKLLNLFKEHDISAIPYKGPVLAASAYGNLALRQFGDLDILVSERDFHPAKELLISQGYKISSQFDWEHSFIPDDGRYSVDLHQGITPRDFPFRLDFERLWQRVEPLSLAGTTVVNLSPEDLLIVLCVQVFKDSWYKQEKLAKLCDLAELLRVCQTLDWGRVMEQASALGGEGLLVFGLLLASELLGTAIPDEVMPRMQAYPTVKLYAAQVCKQLFSEINSQDGVKEKFLNRLMRERPPERVPDSGSLLWHFLRLALIPQKRDRDFLSLPASLSFLYYLIRLIRLVGKSGAIVLKRFPGF